MNGRAIVLRGDAAHLPLPDASVDLIVTSPPYFGLRSYTDGGEHYGGQIGSEATPREYIAALLGCTREWVRLLKPSGSLFVNLGDKYATRYSSVRGGGRAGLNDDDGTRGRSGQNHTGVGEKSLLGLPWRYALGCIDDLGLILRAEIVWAKPNGLPESVTDRVRRSHEQVFHFTRQPRYFAAVDEVREGYAPGTAERYRSGHKQTKASSSGQTLNGVVRMDNGGPADTNPLGKLPGSVWEIPSQPLTVPAALGVDHFAAFPMELPRRIILGWSPSGICTACGEGRRPVVDDPSPFGHVGPSVRDIEASGQVRYGATSQMKMSGGPRQKWKQQHPASITGYACGCPSATAPALPAVVLDPFGGTGTTALVAAVHGRTGVSVDRSADYCRLARWRVSDPAERARAMNVPKPPPVADGQEALFSDWEVTG